MPQDEPARADPYANACSRASIWALQRLICGHLRRKEYHHYGLWRPKIVFTIHNAEYGLQSIASAAYYSQRFTTVSPSYASKVLPLHTGMSEQAEDAALLLVSGMLSCCLLCSQQE